MTNNELKQLRRLLFLDVTEAAQWVGQCEARTWQRWEKGDRAIPTDVATMMQQLALSRMDRLEVEYNESDPDYRYFETYDEYKIAGGTGSALMWRLSQSVATALLCEREAEKWRAEETIS